MALLLAVSPLAAQSDDGPTLEETMRWIARTVERYGQVNNARDEVRYEQRVILDPQQLDLLVLHRESQLWGYPVEEERVTIPLREVYLFLDDASFMEDAEGYPLLEIVTRPDAVEILHIRGGNRSRRTYFVGGAYIFIRDEDTGQRLLDAILHAARLVQEEEELF